MSVIESDSPDAAVKPRAHRRAMPERDTVDWSPPELAREACCVPLDILTAELSRNGEFVDDCLAVRHGRASAADLAGRAVRRPGKGRQVMERLYSPNEKVIERALECGASEGQAIALALINEGRPAVMDGDPFDRKRWRREGNRYEVAATMLAQRATGRCLRPHCLQKIDGGRPYCSQDMHRAAHNQRADQEAIRHLLHRCADALGIA